MFPTLIVTVDPGYRPATPLPVKMAATSAGSALGRRNRGAQPGEGSGAGILNQVSHGGQYRAGKRVSFKPRANRKVPVGSPGHLSRKWADGWAEFDAAKEAWNSADSTTRGPKPKKPNTDEWRIYGRITEACAVWDDTSAASFNLSDEDDATMLVPKLGKEYAIVRFELPLHDPFVSGPIPTFYLALANEVLQTAQVVQQGSVATFGEGHTLDIGAIVEGTETDLEGFGQLESIEEPAGLDQIHRYARTISALSYTP